MSFQIGTALFNANNSAEASIFTGIFGNYNTPYRIIMEDGGIVDLLLSAGEFHAIAFACISGSGSLKIADGDALAIVAGEAAEWTASTLLDQDMNFHLISGKIVVTGIRRPPAV